MHNKPQNTEVRKLFWSYYCELFLTVIFSILTFALAIVSLLTGTTCLIMRKERDNELSKRMTSKLEANVETNTILFLVKQMKSLQYDPIFPYDEDTLWKQSNGGFGGQANGGMGGGLQGLVKSLQHQESLNVRKPDTAYLALDNETDSSHLSSIKVRLLFS